MALLPLKALWPRIRTRLPCALPRVRFSGKTAWPALGTVILGVLSGIVTHYVIVYWQNRDPLPAIVRINDETTARCGSADRPCDVSLEENLAIGRRRDTGTYIYLVIVDIKRDVLRFAEAKATALSGHPDWALYFSLGPENVLDEIFRVFAIESNHEVRSADEVKHIGRRSSEIFLKATRPGAYRARKAAELVNRLPMAPLSSRTSSPRPYIDVYLGQKYFNQSETTSRTVVANLLYGNIQHGVVRAQIDWGEGDGLEDVPLHRSDEIYHVHHDYRTLGSKRVTYRITDGRNEWVEAEAFIIIKGASR